MSDGYRRKIASLDQPVIRHEGSYADSKVFAFEAASEQRVVVPLEGRLIDLGY
jgi:hypothetical protein